MYAIQFAPDGENYQGFKAGKIDGLWNYFNFNPDIREQIVFNRFAKFRLINLKNNKVIGELPKNV